MLLRTCFILFAACLWVSCNSDRFSSNQDGDADSTATQIDTLVSDVSWDEDFGDEEPYHGSSDNTTSSSSVSSSSTSTGRGGGGGGVADNDEDVVKYQSYKRNDDTPQEFANALLYPAIRMVYSDNFARPRAKVLNTTKEGDRHIIELDITWRDHWVSKYQIKGTLEVNSDGSDAAFVITDKNMDAEVLELTEDQFEREIRVTQL